MNWDQRGAGKSYAAIVDTGRMTIGQFVEDTGELTRRLLERFHQDRLVLVGWQQAVVTQRRLLGRFGGEVHGSRSGALRLVLGGLLFSREHTLGDRIDLFRCVMGSMELLWPELLEVNLQETVPELAVPVFFVEGRHDHESPAELAEEYLDALSAPSKELVWFEHSAHLPRAEERDRFTRFMVEKVLPVATRHAPRATTGGAPTGTPPGPAPDGPERQTNSAVTRVRVIVTP
ncbi:alpha/beta fold hydrolase [Kocuria sp. CPCC 205263]|uniref:alpha/beta fold hydrolase n=1 Tax=Kocuria sp. CPCC 205263 TaxID=3073555 RepID=UPI0034D5C227